ncbi:MAG: uracil-DNA glycosylase [Oscillospiraceae bacterium]|jgi:DNA polymerase|nr:uracil-DNA glycosylase [Oscillospiraceae bacterium]
MYKSLKELQIHCLNCTKCELCKTRKNVVLGVGNEESQIMFVGEGPGEKEDLTGEPFVGRAGKLLDKMLEYVDLSREKNIYIANIVKCRPPKNRDPFDTEQEACIDWLRNQILLIRPRLVVCLGRVAARRIIKNDFKITKEHGILYKKGNIFFMATFHPSALLRSPQNKPAAFEDFLKIKEKIENMTMNSKV